MPFVLRLKNDESNPTIAVAYGKQLTAGRLVYWNYASSQTSFLVLLAQGGKYGLDGIDFFRYAGIDVPEFQAGHVGDESYRNWRFHPGTVTAQIVPQTISSVNVSTDVLTANAHGYVNTDPVRVKSIGGVLPAGLSANNKYFIVSSTTNTFKLSATSGGAAIDLTAAGSGTLQVWKANTGFDDPVQGRPQFFPLLNNTFSNISYIEGILPALVSANEEPTAFQLGLRCRQIADFDSTGAQTAINFSANNARVFADVVLNELKLPSSRIDWTSWAAWKAACDVLVWFRSTASTGGAGTGLTGRYFNHPAGQIPMMFSAGTLVLTRTDPTIDLNWGTGSPGAGVNADWFLVRWEGQIKAEFSETYTFTMTHYDNVEVWVDNQKIISNLNSNGVDTGTIALTARQLVNIKIEGYCGTGNAQFKLQWTSASQTIQVVPTARLYQLDMQATRYEAHVVFASATPAWSALEEIVKRSPGWHVQDVNGTLTFLPPTRTLAHTFVYDPAATAQRWNVAANSFEAAPRRADERPNWRLHFYRDLVEELYAEKWVEGDRPPLREKQGGLPTDSSPARWGVMSRSLATRIAESEMKLFSDPDRQFSLRGQIDSYHVSKGDRVKLAHIVSNDLFVSAVECLVTSEGFGAGAADEKSYTLLPILFPYYTDEIV